MRFAVISDIHGNMQALNAVIGDLKSQNCEQVLCLGDLAMAGPQPDMAVDLIKNQANWTVIQGNTDKLIADFNSEIIEQLRNAFPVMANALADDVSILNDEQKDYLRRLPAQKELTVDGVKILMVHGSPRRNNEDILPDKPIAEIEEIIKDTDADLILCGHTHIPCGYQTSKKQTVVNVGSVGRPFTDGAKSCYVVLTVENGSFSVEHRFVDYDRELASSLLIKRGYEGSEKLAKMLINPQERHI